MKVYQVLIPVGLHKKVKKRATAEAVTIREVVVTALMRYFEEEGE